MTNGHNKGIQFTGSPPTVAQSNCSTDRQVVVLRGRRSLLSCNRIAPVVELERSDGIGSNPSTWTDIFLNVQDFGPV